MRIASAHFGRTYRRAFTLVELVLVMVVIAVVLAMAAPSLKGFFASRQTADAAANVLSLTRYARSGSISLGAPYRLNFESDGSACWLTVQKAGAYVEPEGELARRLEMPEGASISLRDNGQQNVARGPGGRQFSLGGYFGKMTQAQAGAAAANQDPSCVQFYPDGRCDAATIEIRGQQGDLYLVTADSATEPFRVVTPSEGEK